MFKWYIGSLLVFGWKVRIKVLNFIDFNFLGMISSISSYNIFNLDFKFFINIKGRFFIFSIKNFKFSWDFYFFFKISFDFFDKVYDKNILIVILF